MLLLLFWFSLHPGKLSFSEFTLSSKIFYKALATDLWDSCFLWVMKVLLPMGKTMYFLMYFLLYIVFLYGENNSYPASLTVHHCPFLTGMLASARWFLIYTKYRCFTQITPSEFSKLLIWFSITFLSLKNVNGILLVCNFNDLMWSSTDNFKSFTEYKPATGYLGFVNAPQLPFDSTHWLS